MRMQRYMVVLFGKKVENDSTKKIVYALSPEQAMQTAVGAPDMSEIKFAGNLDGVPFYSYRGEEHIVHQLPNVGPAQ